MQAGDYLRIIKDIRKYNIRKYGIDKTKLILYILKLNMGNDRNTYLPT